MAGGQFRIRDMEIIVALHEEGNMTQAAKRLGFTEPALSKQLKEIERRIQTLLFERGNGGVVATASGRAFVAHAIESIQSFRRAIHDAHESKHTLPSGDALLESNIPAEFIKHDDKLRDLGLSDYSIGSLLALAHALYDSERHVARAKNATNDLSQALGVRASFTLRCVASNDACESRLEDTSDLVYGLVQESRRRN
jgi:molybdenum-dependent DNA-binding transcriptional regulator ModE